MAVAAGDRTKAPPDVRGGTAPLPLAILVAGIAAVSIVLAGSLLLQVAYAFGPEGLTADCAQELVSRATGKPIDGAIGVCDIYEAITSPAQLWLLITAITIGLAAVIAGAATYRRMPSKRMREQAIAGAVLGIQAVILSGAVLLFRSGEVMIFVRNFFNFGLLEDYGHLFAIGIRNTLMLAFGGEIGGIIIGLILAVLAISKRKTVRAPARAYINFFRGTPLIWQLSFFFFLFLLGFQIRGLSGFSVALLVFSLNTGAYSAEVFRAGIQSIERGQMEAARSLGMSYLQAMRYAIIPQAVRRVIPPLMNEFVILIKDTALIVVLGLTLTERDILSAAREGQAATFNATFYVAAAFLYLVVTLPLIRLVNMVERRLQSGLTGIVGL